jgi:sigma-E factor negative regulatory protein RseB
MAAALIIGAVLAPPLWAAEDDPRRWLADMERAFVEQPYDGVFTFYSGHQLATLRVVHMKVDGEPRERLFHMNGAPREILRRGGVVTYRTAAGDSLGTVVETLPGGPLTAAFVRDFAAISRHYELRAEGADRIAGRPARRLDVLPRDADRHGYRLWLDEPSRLLLRSEMVDDRGQRLEIFQFTQVAIG